MIYSKNLQVCNDQLLTIVTDRALLVVFFLKAAVSFFFLSFTQEIPRYLERRKNGECIIHEVLIL